MAIQHQFEPCALPISELMFQTLLSQIEQHSELGKTSITLNFRDSAYSAEVGGYHPVGVSLQWTKSNTWLIQYITDFADVGNVYPELERCVDFDISTGQVYLTGLGWTDIDRCEVRDFYQLWESNFLSYLTMGVYDDIKSS
ncbi:MAG: DUF2787 domain-containing protein [Vibrionaceae bacterium]|nr:DUF2787 domain-containing protein [Vibrionaceae bacterium]